MPDESRIAEEAERRPFPAWQNVIALAPIAAAIGYTMAYLYELGYCSAFGIPSEFIQLQSTNIIATVSRVFISFYLLFWVGFALLLYVNSPSRGPLTPIRRRMLIIAFVLLGYIAFALGYQRAFQEWYLAIVLLVYFALVLFVVPRWTRKDVTGGYIAKLAAQDEADRQAPDPLAFITKRIGWATIGILFFLAAVLLLSYLNGEDAATRQEYFLVPSTDKDSVVLRVYGDRLICTQLDERSNEPNGRLFVLKLDDEPRPVLSLQKVGPLVSSPDD